MKCYKERKKGEKKHKEAMDRLSKEIDIMNFIEASRVLRLITKVTLRKNQIQLVPFFKPYHLDEDNLHCAARPT